MIKVYAGIRLGNGKTTLGKVCDDRILVGKQILDTGYCEYESEENSIIVAVSDGVGGSNCGWKAAEVALEEIVAWNDGSVQDEETIKKSFIRVNDKVLAESMTFFQYQGMAATLSALLLADTHVKVLHVGDSRVYHYRIIQGSPFFRQITEDQNNMLRWQEEIQYQNFSEADLKKINGWNYIISYVGMSAKMFEERMCILNIMNPKGIFLLTSDGVHDYIEKRELRKMLEAEEPWKEKIEHIMNVAVKNGSHDDQSIIAVEYT